MFPWAQARSSNYFSETGYNIKAGRKNVNHKDE